MALTPGPTRNIAHKYFAIRTMMVKIMIMFGLKFKKVLIMDLLGMIFLKQLLLILPLQQLYIIIIHLDLVWFLFQLIIVYVLL